MFNTALSYMRPKRRDSKPSKPLREDVTLSIDNDIRAQFEIIKNLPIKYNEFTGVADLGKGMDWDLRYVVRDLMAHDSFTPSSSSKHIINGSLFSGLDDNLYLRHQVIREMKKTQGLIVPVLKEFRIVVGSDSSVNVYMTFGQQNHPIFELVPSLNDYIFDGNNFLIQVGNTNDDAISFCSWSQVVICPYMLFAH